MSKEKIIIITIPILCAIVAIFSYIKLINTNIDALKFKKEYEKLNSEDYLEIEIEDNNPIVYANYEEILEVIKKGTGIIYLGFPECPWCRNAVPVLFDVAKDNNINRIYYMDIYDERDSYVIEDGNLVYAIDDNGKEKKGTEGYFKLLEALDKYLTDYTILFDDKTYEVGEKRIYAPSVIFVKEGKVLGIHVSTVESHTNPNKKLTESQYDELYSIYQKYIDKMYSGTCSIDSSC